VQFLEVLEGMQELKEIMVKQAVENG